MQTGSHNGDRLQAIGQDAEYSSATKTSSNVALEVDTEHDAPRRSVLACTRCRRYKVRCTGGDPCDRCCKARSTCKREAHVRQTRKRTSVEPGPSTNRHKSGPHDHTSPLFDRQIGSVGHDLSADARPHQDTSNGDTQFAPVFSDDTLATTDAHGSSYISSPQTQLSAFPRSIAMSSQYMEAQHGTMSFANIAPPTSDTSRAESCVLGISHCAPPSHGDNDVEQSRGPEQRLAMAISSGSEAPFKPLVYRPAGWNNQEESAMNSPEGVLPDLDATIVPGSSWISRPVGRSHSDPVNTGLIDALTCTVLYDFYVEHCHPFLPIVDIGRPQAFEVVRESPALICSIAAVASRFYHGYLDRTSGADLVINGFPSDSSLPTALANLAEEHLSDILLHKRHTLADVQAILLLAAWGLRSGGGGPDAWVISGHASRVGMRLGLHQTDAKIMRIESMPDDEHARKINKMGSVTRQRRTWLCWSWFDAFISLGFGRPATGQLGSVEDQTFLVDRLARNSIEGPSLTLQGDLLIIAQVRLAQLGREASSRAATLKSQTDPVFAGLEPSEPTISPNCLSTGLRELLIELNASLDDWYKLWIWAGAPYASLLAGSSHIIRLQAEHVRLCLNSHALEQSMTDSLSKYIQKAVDAAISIIQIHSDSSQTGLALSFAPDYVTLCLPQAALFLIKMYKTSATAQVGVNLDKTVIAHYLTMSIKILASSDISSTGLSTHLSNTVSAISRVAGILAPPDLDQESQNTSDLAEFHRLFGSNDTSGGGVDEDSMFGLFGDQEHLHAGPQDNAYNAGGQVADFSWLMGEGWNQ